MPFVITAIDMSLRSTLKRYLPERHKIQEHKHLQFFGTLLHDPNLWHLTRHSSAGGVAVGLFCAFIPIPIHMFIAVAVSILFRVNLPLAVIFTWITNPITFGPIFIFAYKTGTVLLNEPVQQVSIELSFQWVSETLIHIWEPLLLGCFILGSVSAIAGYISIRLLWRLLLVRKWGNRRLRRLENSKAAGKQMCEN